MPYLETKELSKDKIKLWYITNLRGDNIANIDRSKPNLVIFHGMFLSTHFLANQMNDPRLKDNFNIFAFDSLACGNTKNPVSPARDIWCDAALTVHFIEALKLGPVHIMANGMNPVSQALKFAMLFPERCLSLTLVGIPGQSDLEWCSKAYQELLQLWCFAPDQSTVEDACLELIYFLFGNWESGLMTEEQVDEVAGHLQKQWPPCRRTRLLDLATMLSMRAPHPQSEYDLVTCPVLLITGESSVVHTLDMAEDLKTGLRNAKGGCRLQVIKGGSECLHLPAPFASLVNRYTVQFIMSAERDKPAPPPQARKIREVVEPALEKLSKLAGDPKMKKRDVKSIWAFSRVPPEGLALKEGMIKMFAQGERDAYNPIGKDGEPPRKFSRRHESDLFLSPQHGNMGAYGEAGEVHIK